MSIQWSEVIVTIGSAFESWSNHHRDARLINLSDGCSQNWKDQPKCTCDIMAKDVENSKRCPHHSLCHECRGKTSLDSKNGRDLVIASRFSKKTKMLGGKCCMPYQPSKPRHHPDFFRQGMIYPREGSWQGNYDLKVRQQSHSVRAKTLLPKRTYTMTLSKDWVNHDLNLTEKVQHYKQT